MDGAQPRMDRLVEASASVSAEELDAARFGFRKQFPQRSAERVLFVTQALAFAALISGLIWALVETPALTFAVLHISALALFALVIIFRFIAAAQLQPILTRLADPVDWPIYTVLCPLYREAKVVPDLVAAISALDYPGLMPQSVKSDTGGLSTRCTGPHVKEHMRYGDYRSAVSAKSDGSPCRESLCGHAWRISPRCERNKRFRGPSGRRLYTSR